MGTVFYSIGRALMDVFKFDEPNENLMVNALPSYFSTLTLAGFDDAGGTKA